MLAEGVAGLDGVTVVEGVPVTTLFIFLML